MRISFYTLFIFTLLVGSQAYAYDYIRPISIQNSSDVLTNYQLSLTVDTATPISEGKMKSDCRDIRFLDLDKNTIMNHWVEKGCNTNQTTIWVKVPYLPANQLSYIYLIHGDESALGISNADGVFDFYDDFNGVSLDENKWIVERNDGLKASVENGALHVQAVNTAKLSRFIMNSSYKFKRDVRIDWNFNSEFNLALQLGHLVKVGRMYINSISDVRWTTQTWNPDVFEQYNQQVRGALGCDTASCYPDSSSFIPVGNAWRDSYGQRMGPLADGLGISVVDILGDNDVYQNNFSMDWIRVRAYTANEPSYFIENEDIYINAPASAVTLSCDAEISSAYSVGFSDGTASLSNDIQTLQDSLNDSLNKALNLEASIDQLINDNTVLGNDFNTCTSDIGLVSDQLSQCQAENELPKLELSQCKSDLGISTSELGQCQESLGLSTTLFSQCASDLSTSKTQIEQCQTNLGISTTLYSQCQTDLTASTAVIGQQKVSLDTAAANLQQCQTGLDESKALYQQCTLDLTKSSEQIETYKASLNEVNGKLDNVDTAISLLEEMLASKLPAGGNNSVKISGATPEEKINALNAALQKMPQGQIKKLVDFLK